MTRLNRPLSWGLSLSVCVALVWLNACASSVPVESIAPVLESDALDRLPSAGGQPILTAQLDYPLLAAAVFAESNRRRQQRLSAPLGYMPALETVSTLHARDMVRHNFFDHVNPFEPVKRTLSDRLDLVDLGGSFYAENIAKTFAIQIDLRSDEPVSQTAGKAWEKGRSEQARTDSHARHTYQSTLYPLDEPGQFSLTPYGPPIPPHTYASFARDLVESWMNSPSHRRNLLTSKARYLGCGCALQIEEAGLAMLFCAQVFYAP